MHVTIELPDGFAQRLQARWQDTLAHYAREGLVMEACRNSRTRDGFESSDAAWATALTLLDSNQPASQ